MADGTAEDRALDALTRILDAAISPEAQQAQQLVLRRLATSGDLFPARVPPPRNITEVGGYLNLLADRPELLSQVLAAALGVAGPNPTPGFDQPLPPAFLVRRANDRPAGPAQAATPVQIEIRSDLVSAFDAAREALHARGGRLPVRVTAPPLPAHGTEVAVDVFVFTGRVLELVPAAALHDPEEDPLVVGSPPDEPLQVAARQLDGDAPQAGEVDEATWSLWRCDADSCEKVGVTDRCIPLGPILNAAGWYQGPLLAPVRRGQEGGWERWTNVTGLVVGRSTLGEELALVHTQADIARSALRDLQGHRWDGTTFSA
jgi:hypothetical protein